MKKSSDIRNILHILSKKNSFEIISYCYKQPRLIRELSDLLDAPYTSVKDRLDELVDADILIKSKSINSNTGRINTSYKTRDFLYILDPRRISIILAENNNIN